MNCIKVETAAIKESFRETIGVILKDVLWFVDNSKKSGILGSTCYYFVTSVISYLWCSYSCYLIIFFHVHFNTSISLGRPSLDCDKDTQLAGLSPNLTLFLFVSI
jgi:hypothetical protein